MAYSPGAADTMQVGQGAPGSMYSALKSENQNNNASPTKELKP
jgi:hypothetical protein